MYQVQVLFQANDCPSRSQVSILFLTIRQLPVVDIVAACIDFLQLLLAIHFTVCLKKKIVVK